MKANSVPSFEKLSTHLARTAAALAWAMLLALTIVATPGAQAQTYNVIHTFTGGGDGANPFAGVTIDAAGNLYGTTAFGGSAGNGSVFKLTHSQSGWVLASLYIFAGGNDGAAPWGRVALARDGSLYGTTHYGGDSYGCGTVFHLTPSPTAPKSVLAPWNEIVLYRFTFPSAGCNPQGDLTFDQSGSIYGTTLESVYELTPTGGGWTETTLYQVVGLYYFHGGVVFDKSGNLYGVENPYGNTSVPEVGSVYQLSPSGSGWTGQTLYAFTGGSDGADPYGGLILDPSGNLYGTTQLGGSGGGGTAFELTPANGGWTLNTLYGGFSPGCCGGPYDKLVMDAAGNLYGTTASGGAYGGGNVFKLTHGIGGWTYTSLYDFTGGSDGANPISTLVFDANGNLYGTAAYGGAYGNGVVFEITP